ncbi:hypothetical protein AGMMS49579_11120 [Spirochaetia bacterium]|nr:hypothetical protein AGMMS49579_11120 [Spirochaetia bacterium]
MGTASPYDAAVYTEIFTSSEILKDNPEFVKKLIPPAGLGSGVYIILVGQRLNTVYQKHEQVQKTKNLAGMAVPVSKVVLKIVAVVF